MDSTGSHHSECPSEREGPECVCGYLRDRDRAILRAIELAAQVAEEHGVNDVAVSIRSDAIKIFEAVLREIS